MCELDEKLRPDFKFLNRKLSTVPYLCNKRIQEHIYIPFLV
jgi:hypothetical protein